MTAAPNFLSALKFWLKLGLISFGGPAGQISIMHAELVERRRWIDEAEFLNALNYCMLLPGPEAMQLASWCGWRLHGLRGGFVAGTLFFMPGALLILALTYLYLAFGNLPAVGGILLGLQAAVVAVLLNAIWHISKRVLKGWFSALIAIVALAVMLFGLMSFPLLLLSAATAGVLSYVARSGRAGLVASVAAKTTDISNPIDRPSLRNSAKVFVFCLALWWLPLLGVIYLLGPDSTTASMALFFSKTAMITFGGAYAVLPYVADHAVSVQWLDAEQMLIGLGLAETTPGPLILVLEYVGITGAFQNPDLNSVVASALLGGAVSLWASFAPCFMFVLPAAPWLSRLQQLPLLAAAMGAISAAVLGIMAHLSVWFCWHLVIAASMLEHVQMLAIFLISALLLLRWRRSVPEVVMVAALLGSAMQLLLQL